MLDAAADAVAAALDYARSYAPQVRAIAEKVGQPSCIAEVALGRPHIAALRMHGNFNLMPLPAGKTCRGCW